MGRTQLNIVKLRQGRARQRGGEQREGVMPTGLRHTPRFHHASPTRCSRSGHPLTRPSFSIPILPAAYVARMSCARQKQDRGKRHLMWTFTPLLSITALQTHTHTHTHKQNKNIVNNTDKNCDRVPHSAVHSNILHRGLLRIAPS